MNYFRIPPLIGNSLRLLIKNLGKDLDYFWPAPYGQSNDEGREMHEDNIILQLGAILKPKAYIYTQVSTNEHPNMDADFVAISHKEDWFLICEAKRGYGTSHVRGISTDIERILLIAKSKTFQGYDRAYGLILVTVWDKSEKRALIRAWKNDLRLNNKSPMTRACRFVTKKLDGLNAKRGILKINDYGDEGKHFLLYALFKLDVH
jgi:hypothetical protein